MNVAFDDPTLEPTPTWTRLDSTDNLVASYTIDRGRQFELDRTDGGRATVTINDRHGVLDPTNASGPYYGKIEPLLQVILGRYNPVATEWQTRFRGFISDFSYDFDHSQQVNRLTLELVDIFEIVQAIEMVPGQFGDAPPAASVGQVFYDTATNAGDRITQALTDAGIPVEFYVVFSLNVSVFEAVYSSAESVMTVIQETADAEFPGISNVYPDRFGRMAVHGRLSKFDPATIAAGAGDDAWAWKHRHCGDHAAVIAVPSTTAYISEFSFNRGLSKLINSALATPVNMADADVAGQLVQDPTSIGQYGIRSWSAQNLLTKEGLLDSSDAATATKQFATFMVDNYKAPHNRVTTLGFRTVDPNQVGAAVHWRLLCEGDIADQIDVTIASPGGGGFTDEPFFIEGIHEESRPLNATYDDVTMTLDVSPPPTDNPFPTS